MIAKKDYRKERCKQAQRATKPQVSFWGANSDPIGMAAYMLTQKRKKKKK